MRGAVAGSAGTWLAAGIDLLFPPTCVLCRRDMVRPSAVTGACGEGESGGALSHGPTTVAVGEFCAACVVQLVDTSPRCPSCASEMHAGACRRCRGRTRDHDGIVVLGGYGDGLREAVLRAKRPAGRPVAAGLARLLHERHGAAIRDWGVDIVAPVPMHWWRRVLRGSSAADIIATELAAAARLPVRGLLRRRRFTVMQNRLPPERRRGNVRDAFAIARGPVLGKRILLVDDVVTTGGTIAACRRTLVDAGAIAVHVAVIARADHGSDDGASPSE